MLDVRWPPFIVRDANRQALAYVYFEEEPGRRAAAKLLTCDQTRCIPARHDWLFDTGHWRHSGLCGSLVAGARDYLAKQLPGRAVEPL
jgi:hypothetical protein